MKQPRGFNQKDADKKIRLKEEDKMMGGKMMRNWMIEIALRRARRRRALAEEKWW